MTRRLLYGLMLTVACLTLGLGAWVRMARAEDPTTTFTGTYSDYWHVYANWTNGWPTSEKDGIIDHDNCIAISYTEQVKDLTVNDGCTLRIYGTVLADTLTVADTGTVLLYGEGSATVANTIDNDGAIIIDSHLGGFVKTNYLDGIGVLIVEDGTLYFNSAPGVVLNKDCSTVSQCLPGD